MSDSLWFQDAILYELRVRSFYDSDGDGIGDLNGVI
jgi:maltose alpha-D-glucosyltransferase/alpha-amylase